ncbi:MAG: DUF2167 domain-containing protein [Limisphaerales bacterium]
MPKLPTLLVAALISFGLRAWGQDDTAAQVAAQKLVGSLQYKHGDIPIQNGLATLNVPAKFKYLDAADAKKVLVQLWGNPPEQADDVIGLLMPSDVGPLDTDCWVVTVSYKNDGYVADNDASKINYDDLLKKMQKAVSDSNKQRVQKGYPAIQLVGWAAPPRYDAATHKLYWAKEIKFGGQPEDTLNYEIRILGRRGVLDLDAVAGMDQLPEIEQRTPDILSMVNFDQGNRYADFNPKVDKVAKYGIAALVAGGAAGVAAKLGLFKLLWVSILALKKFIIVAIVAIAAFFKKIFRSRSSGTPS